MKIVKKNKILLGKQSSNLKRIDKGLDSLSNQLVNHSSYLGNINGTLDRHSQELENIKSILNELIDICKPPVVTTQTSITMPTNAEKG